MTENKKIRGMGNAEMVGFLEELAEPILSHLPFKSASRMKCVCKSWCRLISPIQQTRNRKTASRLLCQYLCSDSNDNFDTKVTVLHVTVQPQGKLELVKNSKGLSLANDFLFLGGSSDGFLLCCSKQMNEIHICDLTSYNWLYVPPMGSDDYYGNFLIGLSVVDQFPIFNYKLVCASLQEKDLIGRGFINYKIFSADIGQWREHQTILVNFALMDEVYPYSYNPYTPYLYTQGVIHWLLDECLLMYHAQHDFFKVIQLPRSTEDLELRLNTSFWDSGGRLHYCYCNTERFSVWTYDGEDLYDCVKGTRTREKWKLKYRVELKPLGAEHPEIFETIDARHWMDGKAGPLMQPCGFDEDLQIMYLHIPGMILHYNFDTQCLGKVWSYELRNPIPKGLAHSVLLRLCLCFPVQFRDIDLPLKDNNSLSLKLQ